MRVKTKGLQNVSIRKSLKREWPATAGRRVASEKETPRRRGEEEARRERSREFTTHDKHKFVLLSTIFIYYSIVLVFEEWTHNSNSFGVRERKERGRARRSGG